MGTDIIGGDRLTKNTVDSESKKKSRSRVVGWMDWSKEILVPTLALKSPAWIQNPSLSPLRQYKNGIRVCVIIVVVDTIEYFFGFRKLFEKGPTSCHTPTQWNTSAQPQLFKNAYLVIFMTKGPLKLVYPNHKGGSETYMYCLKMVWIFCKV